MALTCFNSSMGSRRGRWVTIVNGPDVFNSQTRRNFTYQKRRTVKRHCGRCLLLGEVTSFLLQGPPLGCWTRRPRFSQRPWPEELVGCCFCSERKPHATSNFDFQLVWELISRKTNTPITHPKQTPTSLFLVRWRPQSNPTSTWFYWLSMFHLRHLRCSAHCLHEPQVQI